MSDRRPIDIAGDLRRGWWKKADLYEAAACIEDLDSQIDKLARFILDEIPDEPSRPEGAVDTAIRLLRSAHDTTEHVAATEARIRMVHELHTAIYGDSWARPESAKRVWKMLLAKVADLSARSKANGIEIGS